MTKSVLNVPALWASSIPVPGLETHKYSRGHAVILGGGHLTGAARLASEAAMRIGAGLCTIVTAPGMANVYRQGAPHIMVETYDSLSRFCTHLADLRRNAVLMGPGAGQDDPENLRSAVLETLALGRKTVLDADALTVFAGETGEFFKALQDNCVLTPHDGEFTRLFGTDYGVDDVAGAARKSGAVILRKGAKTVIAHPDGRVVINDHATPWLATAGAGDVLAGMITGLLAQGMPVFEACCAAAWIHGEAGIRTGPGLVAPDLIVRIPEILSGLISR